MKTGIYTVAKTLCRVNYVCDCVLLTQVSLTLSTPRTIAGQAPLPIGFSKQEKLEWVGSKTIQHL